MAKSSQKAQRPPPPLFLIEISKFPPQIIDPSEGEKMSKVVLKKVREYSQCFYLKITEIEITGISPIVKEVKIIDEFRQIIAM